MNNKLMNQNQPLNFQHSDDQSLNPYAGPRWLVEERDACGVGFIANRENQASHELVLTALSALTCLEHRGGCSADYDSGDGAGLLTAIPWELLQQSLTQQGREIPPQENCAVAMVFLPQEPEVAQSGRELIEQVVAQAGLSVIGWRVVPVQPQLLGIQARENQPQIEQVIVSSQDTTGDDLERQLYVVRRSIHRAAGKQSDRFKIENFYICSFSSRTIVYKGMVRSAVLGEFYTDLKNPAYKSAFAVYHRRFSTNTMPKWPLAQPIDRKSVV